MFHTKKNEKLFQSVVITKKTSSADGGARLQDVPLFMSFDDSVRLFSPSFLFMSRFFHFFHSNWISLRLMSFNRKLIC